MTSISSYYQTPLDVSAIYLDNTYAKISFTTSTNILTPNYYYHAVAYDACGNYYEASGMSSPIIIDGLTVNTNYSCYVELVQYSTSIAIVNRTLPWPKIYSIYLSDVSYSSLKVNWTGVDISYITVTRAIGTLNLISDISTTSIYTTFYNDGDISGNTTYYYYVTPFSTYNGMTNTGTKSLTVSTKTLPAPPTNLTSTFYDSSSISVSFNLARNSYSTSYYYILRTTDVSGVLFSDVSGNTSPIQNYDLSGNTTYTMRVITAIDNSLSLYATSTTSVTRTTLVRPPINISVAYYDNSSIRVTYLPGKNTYNTIYYTFYASDAPRNFYTSISGSTNTLSLSNLSGNTSYTLGVINTLNGNLILSGTSVYGTQLTLAQAPYSPYQSFVDSSSISISFTPGKNTYSSVLYTATATTTDASYAVSKNGSSNTTTVNVGDLSGNTKYNIGVSVTLDGNSAITATSLSKVLSRTYVQAPSNISYSYDSSSVTVSFPTPKNSYATSAYYTAYITDGVNTTNVTSSGNIIVIQGLSSSTSYSYYVKTFLTAKSSVGTIVTYNPYPVITTFSIPDFSYNYAKLVWSGNDISYVRVSRSISGVGYADISNVYLYSFYDNDISGNTVYYYYITPIRNYNGVLKVGSVSSTISKRTLVSPPKDISAIFVDQSSIILSFTSGNNTYNSFYYVARVTNIANGSYKDVSSVSSPIYITDLSNTTNYSCNVRIILDGSQSLVGTSTSITVITKSYTFIKYFLTVLYS